MTKDALQAWRTARVWTQHQAAQYLGTSKYHVCRMERGTAHISETIAILCHLLTFRLVREAVDKYHAPTTSHITEISAS